MRRLTKQVLSLILSLVLALSMLPSMVMASDYENHWAKSQIEQLIEKGVVTPEPGTNNVNPNRNLTRAEMARMINQAFSLEEQADISKFTDVPADAWYAPEIAKAVAAGYLTGDASGTMRPGAEITRQEVAQVATSFLKIAGDASAADFTDAAAISAWAVPAVGAAKKANLMAGDPSGAFRPVANMTRAEAFVVIINMMDYTPVVEAESNVVTVGEDKTFGSEDEHTVVDTLVINGQNAKVINTTVKGDLTITEAVGEGEVTLEGVEVQGNTYVKGGGPNSVRVRDGSLVKSHHKNMVVTKVNVTIRLETGEIVTLTFETGGKAILGEGAKVELTVIDTSGNVVLSGDFEAVDILSKADLTLSDATIKQLHILQEAVDSAIRNGTDSFIDNVIADALSSFFGNGGIGTMETNAPGITVEKMPQNVTGDNNPILDIAGAGGGGAGGTVTNTNDDNPTSARTIDVTSVTVTGNNAINVVMDNLELDETNFAISGGDGKAFTITSATYESDHYPLEIGTNTLSPYEKYTLKIFKSGYQTKNFTVFLADTNVTTYGGLVNALAAGEEPTISANMEIPSDKAVTVSEGKTVTIGAGITLTIDGTLNVRGIVNTVNTPPDGDGRIKLIGTAAALQLGGAPQYGAGSTSVTLNDASSIFSMSADLDGPVDYIVESGGITVERFEVGSPDSLTLQEGTKITVPGGALLKLNGLPDNPNVADLTMDSTSAIEVGVGGELWFVRTSFEDVANGAKIVLNEGSFLHVGLLGNFKYGGFQATVGEEDDDPDQGYGRFTIGAATVTPAENTFGAGMYVFDGTSFSAEQAGAGPASDVIDVTAAAAGTVAGTTKLTFTGTDVTAGNVAKYEFQIGSAADLLGTWTTCAAEVQTPALATQDVFIRAKATSDAPASVATKSGFDILVTHIKPASAPSASVFKVETSAATQAGKTKLTFSGTDSANYEKYEYQIANVVNTVGSWTEVDGSLEVDDVTAASNYKVFIRVKATDDLPASEPTSGVAVTLAYDAKIGATNYTTFAAALADVESGQTITLLRKVTGPLGVSAKQFPVTIDLGSGLFTEGISVTGDADTGDDDIANKLTVIGTLPVDQSLTITAGGDVDVRGVNVSGDGKFIASAACVLSVPSNKEVSIGNFDVKINTRTFNSSGGNGVVIPVSVSAYTLKTGGSSTITVTEYASGDLYRLGDNKVTAKFGGRTFKSGAANGTVIVGATKDYTWTLGGAAITVAGYDTGDVYTLSAHEHIFDTNTTFKGAGGTLTIGTTKDKDWTLGGAAVTVGVAGNAAGDIFTLSNHAHEIGRVTFNGAVGSKVKYTTTDKYVITTTNMTVTKGAASVTLVSDPAGTVGIETNETDKIFIDGVPATLLLSAGTLRYEEEGEPGPKFELANATGVLSADFDGSNGNPAVDLFEMVGASGSIDVSTGMNLVVTGGTVTATADGLAAVAQSDGSITAVHGAIITKEGVADDRNIVGPIGESNEGLANAYLVTKQGASVKIEANNSVGIKYTIYGDVSIGTMGLELDTNDVLTVDESGVLRVTVALKDDDTGDPDEDRPGLLVVGAAGLVVTGAGELLGVEGAFITFGAAGTCAATIFHPAAGQAGGAASAGTYEWVVLDNESPTPEYGWVKKPTGTD